MIILSTIILVYKNTWFKNISVYLVIFLQCLVYIGVIVGILKSDEH